MRRSDGLLIGLGLAGAALFLMGSPWPGFRPAIRRDPAEATRKEDDLKRILGGLSTKDPWGNDYLYEVDAAGRIHVRCLGRDGAEGGQGEDRDHQERQVSHAISPSS